MGISIADATGLGAVADLIKTGIQTWFPNKTAEEQAQMAAGLAIIQGQLAINQVEAASPSLFTSGWRPFIGWVCGAACAWNWMGISLASFFCELIEHPIVMKPLDLSQMWPVLIGMLGIGALRTVEKIQGVAV